MNLWNELKASITGDTVDQIAAATGETPDATRRGLLGAALPAVLAGATDKFSGEAGAGRLLDEARSADPDGRLLDDFGSAIQPGGPGEQVQRNGRGFVGSLFGARTDRVEDAVASHAGISKGAAGPLLAVAGALFLGYLGKRARTGALDSTRLAHEMRDARAHLPSFAPSALISTLGLGETRAETRAETRTAEPRPVAAAGRPKWLPWVVAALAVLALLALFRTCRRAEEAPTAPVTAPATAPAAAPTAPAAPATTTTLVRLPDGTQLNLRPNSLTHGLAAYLADPAAPPPPRRFTFDSLTFDTASNALDAASNATLDELTAILKAYPNAVVVVEGHTDNVGEPTANLELSKRRAEAVRDALYQRGVPTAQVSGVGFGDTKPTAGNDTEQGRAQNRRTDLVVTKK